MLGKKYVVQAGDSLWSIAGANLGDPVRWPEIFEHNNRPNVAASTGKKIADPNLIFIGQTLYIPSAPPQPGVKTVPQRPVPPTARPTPAQDARQPARRTIRSAPLQYKLDDLPPITIASPTHIATVKLSGSITLQSKKTLDFVTFSQKGFEIQVKREADHALGTLVTNTQVGVNERTGEITFEAGITSHADHPNALSTTAAAGVSSTTGLPVLKGKITAPSIRGSVSNHQYLTNNLEIEIEITPRSSTARPRTAPEPVPAPQPAPSARPRSGWDDAWDYLAGGALVVGAGVVIVATLGEDILTGGIGVADDPASFAAAAAMFAGGITLIQRVSGGDPIKVEGYETPDDI